MPCIQIENPDPEIRELIRRKVSANHIDDPAYKLGKKAGAFLQSDDKSYMLVEFWLPNYQPFINYLNELITQEKLDD